MLLVAGACVWGEKPRPHDCIHVFACVTAHSKRYFYIYLITVKQAYLVHPSVIH